MSEQAASWDMMDCTKQHENNMANAKQVLDVHVSKGITVAQSNEHMRNWTEKGWKRATDLGNYDPTREHLNFEVVSGGKIRPIDKGRSIPERMAELLHKRGIKDPNEGLEEPRFRTVVNIIFGGSRTRMQELAFGKQEVDFEKGADNRLSKKYSCRYHKLELNHLLENYLKFCQNQKFLFQLCFYSLLCYSKQIKISLK